MTKNEKYTVGHVSYSPDYKHDPFDAIKSHIQACYIDPWKPWDDTAVRPFTPHDPFGKRGDEQIVLDEYLKHFNSTPAQSRILEMNENGTIFNHHQFKVPGFSEKEIEISVVGRMLCVKAAKTITATKSKDKDFFTALTINHTLADTEEVQEVKLENGVLTVITLVPSKSPSNKFEVGYKRPKK